jgi:Lysine-specific metallo-endopeptidase
MGFSFDGLGPADQQVVKDLEKVILTTVRSAAEKIQHKGGRTESQKWFGDSSEDWMFELGRKLNTLASMINTKQILVAFSEMNERCSSTFASAPPPKKAGWHDFTADNAPMTSGQGQNFRIYLNLMWNGTPLYRPTNGPADSKFQTLVHECTHLFLNTDDDAYGVPMCIDTAIKSPNTAKKTADSWGYFVEEFRLGG